MCRTCKKETDTKTNKQDNRDCRKLVWNQQSKTQCYPTAHGRPTTKLIITTLQAMSNKKIERFLEHYCYNVSYIGVTLHRCRGLSRSIAVLGKYRRYLLGPLDQR
jgi:hypothetical protein